MTKTFITVLLNLILAANILYAQNTLKETVYFDYNKYSLTQKAKDQLNESCDKISDKQLLQITLFGHTDADGSNDYNLTLSKNRVNTVLDYFISKGIDKEKIKIDFLGENRPIAQNENEEGKQKNRRVEIIIENKEPIIGDIYSKLKKESQSFKVKANEDIKIKGKEGTIIKISKNSLINNMGKIVNREIEIELKEFYKKADIISSNLHTMSGGEILETGGMIYISASSSGEKLKLKKGAEMEIEFASKNKIQGMETFIGLQHDQINWVQQYTSVPLMESEPLLDIAYVGYGGDTAVINELAKVDKMILKSNELGWINCDRFYKVENKTDLIVDIDTKYKPVVRLVFKDINSVMPGFYSGDKKIVLNSIPVGLKATLIAFSLVNDEPYFASKDIVISKDQKKNMTLIKTTMTALKDDLQKLN
jgi:hypothetical protein